MRWVITAIVLPILLSFMITSSVNAAKVDPTPTPNADGWTVISLPDGALD